MENHETFLTTSMLVTVWYFSCLVFNHHRYEGWSLHGQVYAISICPVCGSTKYSMSCVI